MEVARLVGIALREYEKDGQKKQYCGLHLVYVEGSDSEVLGSKVEVASCPKDVDPNKLEVGHLYQLQYELRNTKNGKMAYLRALEPVEG